MNPSDLNSKSHPKLLDVVNGSLWRQGHKEFSGDTFPSENMMVFGHFKGGNFTFTGMKETDSHLSTCMLCCEYQDTGQMVADKLILHTQV